MVSLAGAATIVTVSVLFFILGYLLWRGGTAIRPGLFAGLRQSPPEAGRALLSALGGTLELVLLATLIGAPAGFAAGVYLAESGGTRFAAVVRYTAGLLNGVPSILLGILGYALVVVRMHHFSILAGAVSLSIIFIPISVRTTEDHLRAVPGTLREGALALGASPWTALLTVSVPGAIRGILAGMMLAMARIAGEAAPLLFTTSYVSYWSTRLDEPSASLPMMIFTYASSPDAEWSRQSWAAALVLLLLILATNIAALLWLSPRR